MSKPVSIPKPAVQTHAGLYSNFTPSVAAVDQPHPKTLSEAQTTASGILYRAPPSGSNNPRTKHQYMRQYDNSVTWNTAQAALLGPFTMSSKPTYAVDLWDTSYTPPSSYSSEKSLGAFRTGGQLGGGQFSSTGGAIGGVTIGQTGGRFGEGSVSKTGGSLGEALGARYY